MKAPDFPGALFVLGLLFCSNAIFCQESEKCDSVNLGKIVTYIDSPLTTGEFYDNSVIEKSGSTNLSDFLTSQGHTVMNTGGTGSMSNVSIKGYAGFCIKVYIDGVLANNPATGEFDWNQISLDSISSIEIQDFPVENQMQFAGSVVKITTKRFGVSKFTSTSQVTSYEGSPADTLQQSADFRIFTKNAAFKIGGDARIAANEYLTPKNKVNLYNDSKLAQIDASWNLYTKNGSLSATGFFGTNKIKAQNTGKSYDQGVENDINARFTFKHIIWGKKIWHTYGSNYNLTNVEYDESVLIHNSTVVHNLEGYYYLDFKNTGISLYNTFSAEWSKTMDAFRPQLQIKLAYEKQLFPWMIFYGSLGFDMWKNSQNSWSWNNVNFELLPFVRLVFPHGFSAAAFREFVLPTFNQLYWNGAGGVGNPDLENEYGWSGLVSWKKWPVIQLTFQTSWYGNKIRWTSINNTLMPDNTESAWYFAATAASEKSWKYFDYSARINFTRAMLEDGNQIMWVPFLTGALNLGFHYKKLDFNVSGSYTGKRYQQNDNSAGCYDRYFLLDLAQTINISKNLNITVKVSNLLDDRYQYHDGFYAPGRSYSVFLRLKS